MACDATAGSALDAVAGNSGAGGEEARRRRSGLGRPPEVTDAELVCLVVAQVLLRYDDERHWLRAAAKQVGHLFPRLLGQSEYNDRVKAAAPLMEAALRWLADHTPGSAEMLRLMDATPIPCGQSAASPSDVSTAARILASTGPSRRGEVAGLARVTSMSVRILVSGVRSSCGALATNRCWLANAASSRGRKPWRGIVARARR